MPPPPDSLQAKAFEFAADVTRLLNATVTTGVKVRTVMQEDGSIGWVGFDIRKKRPFPGRPIPLKLGKGPAACYIYVMHTVALDEDGYLVATRSSYAVRIGPDLDSPALFRYDYDREPPNDYPNPHFQVMGEGAEALAELNARTNQSKKLEDLHFPVGGKRFRPSLEDLVEFLVVEGFAPGRDGWQSKLNEHRDRYRRIQLKAAVRRDPDAAREALAELGD